MGKEYVRDMSVFSATSIPQDVVIADDFEDFFKWTAGGTSGKIVEKSQEYVLDKNYSMKLGTPTTTPTTGQWAQAWRGIAQSARNKLEISLYFLTTTDADYDLEIKLAFSTIGQLGTCNYFRILLESRPSTSANTIKIYTTGGTYETILATDLYLQNGIGWSKIVLLIDVLKNEYVSLAMNNYLIDLYGKKAVTGISDSITESDVYLRLTTKQNAQTLTYIDNFLVRGVEI